MAILSGQTRNQTTHTCACGGTMYPFDIVEGDTEIGEVYVCELCKSEYYPQYEYEPYYPDNYIPGSQEA